MLTHPTLDQLRALKLDGMARALEEQRLLPACQDLAFEDRLGLLVDRERLWPDGLQRWRVPASLHRYRYPSAPKPGGS